MTPVKVSGQNFTFTKPSRDWDDDKDGECGDLPVRRENGRNGKAYLYSNWMPDEEELRTLNAGGSIELLCVGVQPPVALSVVPGGKK